MWGDGSAGTAPPPSLSNGLLWSGEFAVGEGQVHEQGSAQKVDQAPAVPGRWRIRSRPRLERGPIAGDAAVVSVNRGTGMPVI